MERERVQLLIDIEFSLKARARKEKCLGDKLINFLAAI